MGKLEQEIREALSNPSPRLHQQDEDRLVANISALLTRKLAEAAPPAGDLEEIRGRVVEAIHGGDPWVNTEQANTICDRLWPLVEQLAGERDRARAARDEMDRDLTVALGRVDAARAKVDIQRKGLEAVDHLMRESSGVDGLHLNGNTAPWGDLRRGGNLEEWLLDFDVALYDTPQPPASDGGEVGLVDVLRLLDRAMWTSISHSGEEHDLVRCDVRNAIRRLEDEARARRRGGES